MYLFLKNPANSQTIMHHANELIKYMPISRESADMLTPFFDMTNKRAFLALITAITETMGTEMQMKRKIGLILIQVIYLSGNNTI